MYVAHSFITINTAVYYESMPHTNPTAVIPHYDTKSIAENSAKQMTHSLVFKWLNYVTL